MKQVMSRKQFHQLTVWIEENLPTLRHMQLIEVARKAEEALVFHVPPTGVQDVRDILELTCWRKSKASRPDVSDSQFLAGVLKFLMEKLGEPVPPRLNRIARGEPNGE